MITTQTSGLLPAAIRLSQMTLYVDSLISKLQTLREKANILGIHREFDIELDPFKYSFSQFCDVINIYEQIILNGNDSHYTCQNYYNETQINKMMLYANNDQHQQLVANFIEQYHDLKDDDDPTVGIHDLIEASDTTVDIAKFELIRQIADGINYFTDYLDLSFDDRSIENYSFEDIAVLFEKYDKLIEDFVENGELIILGETVLHQKRTNNALIL